MKTGAYSCPERQRQLGQHYQRIVNNSYTRQRAWEEISRRVSENEDEQKNNLQVPEFVRLNSDGHGLLSTKSSHGFDIFKKERTK